MRSATNSFGLGRAVAASALALSLFFTVTTLAESIPQTSAQSLDGKPISLPKDFAGKPAVFIIGFSRRGGNQCGPLAHKLANESNTREGKVSMYQIAMLESVPRVIRSMVLHSIRGGVPQAEQERFLPLFHDEKQWKQLVGFTKSAENDAYLVLVSSDGTVLWTGHGQYYEKFYSEIKRQLP